MLRAAAILLLLALAAPPARAVSYDLMRGGAPACSIVLAPGAGPVERNAAEELAAYLGKIAGGPAPAIGTNAADGAYPVRLSVDGQAGLDPEGFALKAGPDGLEIVGAEPIGVLYGAYEILKQYGGIRWITPGADGEYFTVKPTIAVPRQATTHAPSFRWRRIFFGGCSVRCLLADSWDWMVRNAMRPTRSRAVSYDREVGEFLDSRGAVGCDGPGFSHMLAGIFLDKSWSEGYACLAHLFGEHPEYFPLINGKRVPLTGDQRSQPCTTHPAVIAAVRANIDAFLTLKMKAGDEFTLFNDDGTGWCQCERCVALDPPEERELRFVSTRFWTFANQVLGPLVDKHPRIHLGAIAYQNFQRAPVGVRPDPRLHAHIAYNRRCYRHALEDPACPVNRVFYEYFQEWSRLGNPSYTWDQINSSASAYMPTEHTFIKGLKTFHELGVNGARPVLPPPDGTYSTRYDGTRVKETWWGMWQTLYLAAQFLWNIESDYEALYEEAGSLYYGPAWPAMKEYRALMVQAATNSAGCFGHGGGSPVGRVLTQPGVGDRLNALLAEAEQAAGEDARARLHVGRDRAFFREVWEKELEQYLANYRELRLYRQAGPLAIDGVLDERDWVNADIITQFRSAREGGPLAEAQTYVRAVYQPEAITFAIEAMEPAPEKIRTEIRDRDGQVWLDNTLEIFLSHPDMDGDYFHLIFNADGVLYDAFNRRGQKAADLAYDSEAEVRTRVLSDRWVAEVRIPTANLRWQPEDGHVWRMNVARARVLTDGVEEASSWSGGAFHGVEYYPTASFAGERALSGVERGMAFIEKDTRQWKNAGFNEVYARDPERGPHLNWTLGEGGLLPRSWNLGSAGGELEMVKTREGDYSLLLKKGIVFQMHPGLDAAYTVRLRAKGKGKLRIWMFRYPRRGDSGEIDQVARREKGEIPSRHLEDVDVASDDWRDLKLEYRKEDPRVIAALALGALEGSLLIDDVFMIPARAAGQPDSPPAP